MIQCPARPKGARSSATGGALVSHTPVDPSTKQILLKGTVSWAKDSFPLVVLVNLGADDNFVDSCFVSQCRIPF